MSGLTDLSETYASPREDPWSVFSRRDGSPLGLPTCRADRFGWFACPIPGRYPSCEPVHKHRPHTSADSNRKEVRHTHQVGCTARSSAGARGAARLYRRLLDAIDAGGAAVHEARRDDIATEHLATAMNELRTQATAITEQLVVVSRLPSAKRQNGFRTLRSQVDEVERLAARIALAGR